MMKMKSKRRT